jgi:glutamyl-tRNA(Gln) amidotransferase subunit E
LPGYGITYEEVRSIKDTLGMDGEDAFLLVADEDERARASLLRAVDRANVGLEGVPEETRDPLPDGRSVYSRPLPGKDRMYPETDVRPIRVDDHVLEGIRLNMPELPEETVARFVKEYRLSKDQADALMDSGLDDEFELLAKALGNPQVVARVYLHAFPELQKDGLSIARLDVDLLRELLTQFRDGAFAKEAIPELLAWMVRNESYDVQKAVEGVGVGSVSTEDLDALCDRIVKEREDFIKERGEASLGPLMGVVMKEVRGKVDGKVISEVLGGKIRRLLS